MPENLNTPDITDISEHSVVVITASEITQVGDNPRHRFVERRVGWASGGA